MANAPLETLDVLKNTVIIALVLFAALVLATKFGLIYCGQIPYWCDAYKTVMRAVLNRNYPAILIAYGDKGMGNPDRLYMYIRQACRLYARKEPIYRLGPGNLDRYDVVIVERARTLTTEQLDMLWDYVASGGKLVFVGDAGVDDGKNGATVYTEGNVENPWDRVREDGTVLAFGTDLLGLRYVGEVNGYAGPLSVEDDILTAAVPQNVPFSGPFAQVEYTGTSVFGKQAVVLSAGKNPLVVRVGYRIVYYAFPPEDSLGQKSIQLAFLLRDLCDWMST